MASDETQGPRYEAALLYEEARRRRAEGNPSGAMPRYIRLLALAERLGDRAWQAELYAEIGELHCESCDTTAARSWYERALAAYLELGSAADAAAARHALAGIDHLSGDLSGADGRFREAAAEFRALGERERETEARTGLARVLWDLGRESEALLEAGEALRLEGFGTGHSAVRSCLGEWSGRVGAARFRRLVNSATEDLELRRLLLPGD